MKIWCRYCNKVFVRGKEGWSVGRSLVPPGLVKAFCSYECAEKFANENESMSSPEYVVACPCGCRTVIGVN